MCSGTIIWAGCSTWIWAAGLHENKVAKIINKKNWFEWNLFIANYLMAKIETIGGKQLEECG